MVKKKWKALFVKEPTHHRVVVHAKELKMTVDEFILYLLKIHESSKQKKS